MDQKKLDTLRLTFQTRNKFNEKLSGVNYSHGIGELAGIANAVSVIMGISWIEADVLLRQPIGTK